jgi:hypothetical protein
MVKLRLLLEKDRGNTCSKNQGKKITRFFWGNFFRGLRFYGADCILKLLQIETTVFLLKILAENWFRELVADLSKYV